MPTITQNNKSINIDEGKSVTISFDACIDQEFKILDPNKKVICENKSISNSAFLFENQTFSTQIGGSYSIIIKTDHIEDEVTLSEVNEIFGESGITKYYNFVSCNGAEVSIVIHS